MRRLRAACLLAMLPAGCASGPLLDNPTRVGGPEVPFALENGALIHNSGEAPGKAYPEVFDDVLDAVADYFPIAYANRYEGRILGKPTLAPGFEQMLRRGSPDFYDRLLASFQAYRYRCEVRIREAYPSGYFVQVIVRKELKDYQAPSGLFTAVPLFGDAATVDRDQFLLVSPDITTPANDPSDRWIPKGRETAIEQAILKAIQKTCH
ncbi:MAG TPA: hypothetical protein VHR66_17035 [Gemmataceae bacterium]|jgi:hypothetical protein|nr:hypothetical protein [Gemmataceae bacterium]